MNVRLLEAQRLLMLGGGGFAARFQHPVLVWPGAPKPPGHDEDESSSSTESGGAARPGSGEVLIASVFKHASKANAHALGITVGRVGTNDVVLNDRSVSRFHAHFSHDERQRSWTLTDGGSQNGTWVNGARLEGSTVVPSGAALRFGEVKVWFLLPAEFRAWVEAGAHVDRL